MYMRDKNGETASERVARKFLSGELYGKTDCNTELEIDHRGRIYMTLYGTRIAWAVSGRVHIMSGFPMSDTALTKARQRALERMARAQGITVTYDTCEVEL